MPHDCTGKEIHVGDTVGVEFTVAEIYPGADFCGVRLERTREGAQALALMCQAKQTILLELAKPAEDLMKDTTDAMGVPQVDEPPARCDCPAFDGPHVHAQGGPEALTE